MSSYSYNDFCYPQPPTTLRDMWPGYFSDQVCVNGDYWVAPPNLLCRIDGPERPSFEPRRLRKEGATYFVTERCGREIRVGDLTLTEKHLVDFKEDGTFAALLCSVSAGESYQARTIAIPFKDLIRRRITPYLADLPRNIDCPISYLIEAFYTELRGGDPCKFLHLPQRSGWQENAGSLHFTSAANVIPVLRDLYPPDILRRRLLHTNLSMKDAALRLKELLLNDCWQTKLILTASAASLTLPYFDKYGLRNNRMLIIRADSVHGSDLATALLHTDNYVGTKICALSECRTVLQRVLDLTQDGTALFRDTSLVEDRRKRDAALNVLVQDLQRGQGISDTRHLIAVIADNPGSYPSEIPAIHLAMPTLKDCDLRQLQHAVGELHAALIHELEGSEKSGNMFTYVLDHAQKQGLLPLRTSTAEPAGGTLCILSITAAWLHCCGLISEKELREIRRFLAGGYRQESAGDQLVINDFRRRLSGLICKDALRVFPQSGPPYYAVSSTCAFTDGRWLNLETSAFDRVIVQLTMTQSRRAVLHASQGRQAPSLTAARVTAVFRRAGSPGQADRQLRYSHHLPPERRRHPCHRTAPGLRSADARLARAGRMYCRRELLQLQPSEKSACAALRQSISGEGFHRQGRLKHGAGAFGRLPYHNHTRSHAQCQDPRHTHKPLIIHCTERRFHHERQAQTPQHLYRTKQGAAPESCHEEGRENRKR